jgi:hypothetical protein
VLPTFPSYGDTSVGRFQRATIIIVVRYGPYDVSGPTPIIVPAGGRNTAGSPLRPLPFPEPVILLDKVQVVNYYIEYLLKIVHTLRLSAFFA